MPEPAARLLASTPELGELWQQHFGPAFHAGGSAFAKALAAAAECEAEAVCDAVSALLCWQRGAVVSLCDVAALPPVPEGNALEALAPRLVASQKLALSLRVALNR
eukprot:Hpha_TRINITY_DN35871_c0_g1::TRINITY_DN35871_c0_g1_i1::g.84928::m.84928